MRIVRERYQGLTLDLSIEALNCGHHLLLSVEHTKWSVPAALSVVVEYPAKAKHVSALFRGLAGGALGLTSLWELREGDTPLHCWRPCSVAGSALYEQPTLLWHDGKLALDFEAMPGWLCARHGKTVRMTVTLRETQSVVALCTDLPPEFDAWSLIPIKDWMELCGVEISAAMAKVPPGDSYGNIWKRNGGGYHVHHINDAKPKAEEAFALEGGAA